MSHKSNDVALNVSSKESALDVIKSSICTDTYLINVGSDAASSQSTIVHVTDSAIDKLEPDISPFNQIPEKRSRSLYDDKLGADHKSLPPHDNCKHASHSYHAVNSESSKLSDCELNDNCADDVYFDASINIKGSIVSSKLDRSCVTNSSLSARERKHASLNDIMVLNRENASRVFDNNSSSSNNRPGFGPT